MSIETDLSSIAQSLATIAAHITAKPTDMVALAEYLEKAKAPVAEAPKQEPIIAAPVPVVTIAAPTPAPVSTIAMSSTFTNAAELTSYVMNAYKTLGPIKGAKIQEVLQSVGAKNINDVAPEHYATVKAGVDALQ